MVNLSLAPKFIAGFTLLALAACSEKELILEGERTAVLAPVETVSLVSEAGAEGAQIGEAVINQAFTHPGASSGHAGGHLTLNWPVSPLWNASIEGAPDETVDLSQPVIAHDAIYALGADGVLTSFDLATGDVKFAVDVEIYNDDPLQGVVGGIAAGEDRILAHASQYDLVALSAEDGSLLWSVTHPDRLKGGPTLIGDEGVLVSDINGQLYLYDLQSGARLWQRAGLPTNTVVFGAPAPAFAGGEVVLAGAGGEISIYEPVTGDLLWADSLASFNPRTPLQELADVRAHPVHDGKLTFILSQSGRMVAFQAATGIEIWEQPITSIEMPWLAGQSIFVMSVEGRLYALRRNDGAARWVTDLPDALPVGVFADENAPRYSGPVVASNMVFTISRAGKLYVFDARSGEQKMTLTIDGTVTTAPAVAQEYLAVLNSQGELFVYR